MPAHGPGDERALLDDAARRAVRLASSRSLRSVSPGTKPSGVGRRSRWRCAPACDSTKPMGRCCSSSRCAIRLAVRARIGTPFTRQQRIAGIQQHRCDRARDIHRQRLAADLRHQSLDQRRQSRCGVRRRRPRWPRRAGARRADPAACAADARSREPACAPRAARRARARAAASGDSPAARATILRTAAPRLRRSPGSPSRSRGCRGDRALQRLRAPRPASCGSRRTLGTSPCSAIATSVASSTRRCAALGSCPVTSSQM